MITHVSKTITETIFWLVAEPFDYPIPSIYRLDKATLFLTKII